MNQITATQTPSNKSQKFTIKRCASSFFNKISHPTKNGSGTDHKRQNSAHHLEHKAEKLGHKLDSNTSIVTSTSTNSNENNSMDRGKPSIATPTPTEERKPNNEPSLTTNATRSRPQSKLLHAVDVCQSPTGQKAISVSTSSSSMSRTTRDKFNSKRLTSLSTPVSPINPSTADDITCSTDLKWFGEMLRDAFDSQRKLSLESGFEEENKLDGIESCSSSGQKSDTSTPGSLASSNSSCSDEDEALTPTTQSAWSSTPATPALTPALSPLTPATVDYVQFKDTKEIKRGKSHGSELMTIRGRNKSLSKMSSSTLSPSTSISSSTGNRRSRSIDRCTSIRSTMSTASFDKFTMSSALSSSSSTSKVMFGKTELRKKEFKAIMMWQSAVQELIMQRRAAQASAAFPAKSSTTAVQADPPKFKNTEKDLAMARFIVGELYSTEKSFHKFLNFIRKNYMEPMKAATQARNPLVKANDVHVLFSHLPELITVSEKILTKLENYAKNGPEPHKVSPGIAIGQIFTDLEEDLVVFLKYAIHYQSHMKAIRRASTSGFVMKIDTESKRTKAGSNNRLGLADYLIAPFQRVPRYELLLKDLIKHTDISSIGTDECSNDLIYAKNIINGLAATMNRVQEKISKSLFSTSLYTFSSQSTATHVASS